MSIHARILKKAASVNGETLRIWTDWKKPESKRKNLIRLGVPYGQAYAWKDRALKNNPVDCFSEWAGMQGRRMGGWAVAQSPILITTITLEWLRKRGYISMLSLYQEISSNHYKNSLFPSRIRGTSPANAGTWKPPSTRPPESLRDWVVPNGSAFCERRSPSVFAGGVVYPIANRTFISSIDNH